MMRGRGGDGPPGQTEERHGSDEEPADRMMAQAEVAE